MNAIITKRPGLLGRRVVEDVYDSFFSEFTNHLRTTTQGYPVADIYREKDGSTVLEFALAGFKRSEMSIDVQPDRRAITVSCAVVNDEENTKRSRIARRNFKKTYVNYDNNLDLTRTQANFENGLLTVRVPLREEVQPISISIFYPLSFHMSAHRYNISLYINSQ